MKISKSKIGILTDLHFGKHKEEKWEKIYDDLLEWIIESYQERDIDHIFILGDIFDGHFSKTKEKGISFKILNYVKTWFDKLTEHFEVTLFSGNHDVTYKDRSDVSACSIFRKNENINLIEDTTSFSFEDMNYKIVPWSCPIQKTASDHKVDGLFCHFDIQSFKMNANKISEHGYSTKELFKHTDRVWSGHYHWYQEREYAKGNNKITYLGTPLQLNWAEAGKESYIHVFDLSKNEVVEMIENKFSPKHVKIKASELEDIGNDFVEIIWDVEKTEELEKEVQGKIDGSGVQTVRFNHEALAKKKSLEYNKIVDSMDAEVLLEEVVDNIEGITDIKKKVLDKAKSYYTMAT